MKISKIRQSQDPNCLKNIHVVFELWMDLSREMKRNGKVYSYISYFLLNFFLFSSQIQDPNTTVRVLWSSNSFNFETKFRKWFINISWLASMRIDTTFFFLFCSFAIFFEKAKLQLNEVEISQRPNRYD